MGINSWGADWGQNGHFRIKRGIDSSKIESIGCWAVRPGEHDAVDETTTCVRAVRVVQPGESYWSLENECAFSRVVEVQGVLDNGIRCWDKKMQYVIEPYGTVERCYGFDAEFKIIRDARVEPPPPPPPPSPPEPPSPPSPPPTPPPGGCVPVMVTIETKKGAKDISWEIDCRILPTIFSATSGRRSSGHYYEDDMTYQEQVCVRGKRGADPPLHTGRTSLYMHTYLYELRCRALPRTVGKSMHGSTTWAMSHLKRATPPRTTALPRARRARPQALRFVQRWLERGVRLQAPHHPLCFCH